MIDNALIMSYSYDSDVLLALYVYIEGGSGGKEDIRGMEMKQLPISPNV